MNDKEFFKQFKEDWNNVLRRAVSVDSTNLPNEDTGVDVEGLGKTEEKTPKLEKIDETLYWELEHTVRGNTRTRLNYMYVDYNATPKDCIAYLENLMDVSLMTNDFDWSKKLHKLIKKMKELDALC